MWKTLCLALAALAVAVPAQAQPPVWIVRDADSEMLLFGSIHVLPPGLDWSSPRLTQSVKKADDLWFELGMDDKTQRQVSWLAQTQGELPLDQSLSQLIGPDLATRLSRVAATYNAPMYRLERLEPWLAEVALASVYYAQSGGDPENGVEKVLTKQVPPGVEIRAFETPAEQIALFDAAPLDEQLASLGETLDDMEARPDQYRELVQAWMAGDVAALDGAALKPLREASPALYKRLVVDRNARWMATLSKRLAGKGRTVVVVGVGHLVGEDGLPSRLRALGYSVEGP
jgi:uncharacterized protein YbaP (TraB family)